MPKTVIEISAVGTRGKVKGEFFSAKKDSLGRYVLNKKTSSPSAGNTTNKAINKIYVTTLNDAVSLLLTNDYRINLVTSDGVRALRQYKKVLIHYA